MAYISSLVDSEAELCQQHCIFWGGWFKLHYVWLLFPQVVPNLAGTQTKSERALDHKRKRKEDEVLINLD